MLERVVNNVGCIDFNRPFPKVRKTNVERRFSINVKSVQFPAQHRTPLFAARHKARRSASFDIAFEILLVFL